MFRYVVLGLLTCTSIAHAELTSRVHLRRPIALVQHSARDEIILVANRDSGSVSMIDTEKRVVLGECLVAARLADLAHLRDDLYVAVDDSSHELLTLRAGPRTCEVVSRLQIDPYPVRVVSSSDGQSCFVTSLWSRSVVVAAMKDPLDPQQTASIKLPFPPRALALLPDQRSLLVAGSFGGDLALVDLTDGRVLREMTLTAHNIRHLVLDSKRQHLLIPHQVLYEDEDTTKFGVHWGEVMRNVVRAMPLAALTSPEWPPDRNLYYLGTPDRATGDPEDIVVTQDGRQIVSYAGTREVAISDPGANHFAVVEVGRRPTDLLLSADQRRVLVANTLSDTVSAVSIEARRVEWDLSLGPAPELTAAQRGEQLFYDASLSSDGWFSCHSCHTDGYSNGLRSDNTSDGGFGAAKRVLSLGGTTETGPWAWNGEVADLAQQVRVSVEKTMRGQPPSDAQVADLVAYLGTLQPAPGIRQVSRGGAASRGTSGRQVFERYECSSCHAGKAFTTDDSFEVGHSDEVGNRYFNPPSLRGVSQRRDLLHDNRAAGLRDLFLRFGHGGTEKISPHDLDDLVGYLEEL